MFSIGDSVNRYTMNIEICDIMKPYVTISAVGFIYNLLVAYGKVFDIFLLRANILDYL